jgi:hypothetical protein
MTRRSKLTFVQREYAAQIVLGRRMTRICKELGIHRSTPYTWMKSEIFVRHMKGLEEAQHRRAILGLPLD